MKKRFMNWAFCYCPSLHFLLRDDVSVRFKIANLITGDRLRPAVAFANMAAKTAKKRYDEFAEIKGLCNDEITCEEYKTAIGALRFYIDKVASEVQDIWTL